MNDISIHDMDLSHVDDIVEIENLSFKTPWSREAFLSEITKNKCSRYRVIVKDGKVIAYGGMWLLLDEAHITNIAVHPEYRGFGFGDIILKDMIEVARETKISSMTLEARVSNITAINLYKKHGFIESAVRKGYYQDSNEDAIIMWKYDLQKQ